MSIFEKIEKKLIEGTYKTINTRYSLSIKVTDGDQNFNCKIIVDDIYNNDDEKLYRIERHIGNKSDYYTHDVYDYKLKHIVESKLYN